MRENKDKIPEDEAKNVQVEIENTKKAIESDDAEQIKKAMEALSQASHKLSEMMYQQASQQQSQQDASQQGAAGDQAASQESSQDSSEEEVIDAEVVDEEKKK